MALTFLSLLVSALIAVILAVTQPNPVPPLVVVFAVLNGTICLRYVFLWLASKIDVADPLGLTGIVGVALFLVSPIVQIGNDYWPFIPSLSSSPEWITLWIGMTTVGLAIFAFIAERGSLQYPLPKRSYWALNFNQFAGVCTAAMFLSLVAQIYIFAKFGGVSGFVDTFSQRQELQLGRTDDDPFNDLGIIMIIAESFKYLFAMMVILYIRDKPYGRSLIFFCFLMSVFAVIFLLFGGLRGSRSSTVLSLVYAALLYHGMVRPIPIKLAFLGILASISFLNVYYWYKVAGVEGVPAIYDESVRTRFGSAREDSNLYVISRDLGRTDVQTLAIVRREVQDMPLQWGRTYLEAPFSIIPSMMVPDKPETLAQAKLDAIYGPGRYSARFRQSTLVFGGAGEAFVNFGYLGFLLFFVSLGWVAWRIRRLMCNLGMGDARRLLMPAIFLLPIGLIMWDAGLLILVLFRALLLPGLVVLCTVSIYRPSACLPGGRTAAVGQL